MVRMARMRRTATKHYEITRFDQIGEQGGYSTPTGFIFMIRQHSNEFRFYFDNHTINMMVEYERNGVMSIDDMDRPYITFNSNDLANEMRMLLTSCHIKHGLE